MSDYHVLNATPEDHEISVVFHIPIPNVNNSVGVNFRTALTQYKPFTESGVPWLDTQGQEFTDLVNGLLYEHGPVKIAYNANLSDAEKQTLIDTEFNAQKTAVQNRLQKVLKYWGHDRDVA